MPFNSFKLIILYLVSFISLVLSTQDCLALNTDTTSVLNLKLDQESSQNQTDLIQKNQRISSWSFDLYAESYNSIAQKVPVIFSRWMLKRSNTLVPGGQLKLGIENFSTQPTANFKGQDQWATVFGFDYQVFKPLVISINVRSENINSQQPSKRKSNLRMGLLGGTFNYLSDFIDNKTIENKSLFIETYYESFLQSVNSDHQTTGIFNMSSGSIKLGYRVHQIKTPLIIDPLLLELRGFNTDRTDLAGTNYSLLNIGPRVIFYHESPNIFASLFATQSWRLDQNPSLNHPTPWFLLTLGGSF